MEQIERDSASAVQPSGASGELGVVSWLVQGLALALLGGWWYRRRMRGHFG